MSTQVSCSDKNDQSKVLKLANTKFRFPIAHRTRFKILQKYGFKCRYCGRGHPQVSIQVLQIDHVVSVADGGKNQEDNLVVACQDCNLGKSKQSLNPIDICLDFEDKHQDEFQEFFDDLDQQLLAKENAYEIRNQVVRRVAQYWYKLAPGHSFSDAGWNKVNTLVERYNLETIINAMDMAASDHLVFMKDNKAVTGESWRAAFSAVALLCEQKSNVVNRFQQNDDNAWVESYYRLSNFKKRCAVAELYIRDKNISEVSTMNIIICDQCNKTMKCEEGEIVFLNGKDSEKKTRIGLIYFSHKDDSKTCCFSLDKQIEFEKSNLLIERNRYDIISESIELISKIVKLFSDTSFDQFNLSLSFLRLTIENFDLAHSMWVFDQNNIEYLADHKSVSKYFLSVCKADEITIP